MLAVASAATYQIDSATQIWDMAHRSPTVSIIDEPGTPGLAFSPDGAFLATISDELLFFRDPDSGEIVSQHPVEISVVTGMAFSPDGHYLAFGDVDDKVQLWDAINESLVRVVDDEPSEGFNMNFGGGLVAFSPDGALLATGRADGRIRLWNVNSGELLRTLEGHESSVTTIAFSSDGTLLASGSDLGIVKVWQVTDGELLADLIGHDYDSNIGGLAFSPDGRILISGSGNIYRNLPERVSVVMIWWGIPEQSEDFK